ncbi:MAG: guanylate kinase [Sedimentisphaerales bacterium]|nr:guanylate kinase [Sedimentisphaerales bacterium]
MAGRKGKLAVISGPSGVGKSTLCREAVVRANAFLSVSCTTRKPGNAETNGKDYWFITPEEFEKRIAEHGFIEYANVYGHYYGTPRQPVEDALTAGRAVILEIDVQGGLQVKQQYPEALMIFIMPPSPEELLRRLEGRRRGEDDASKKRRLDAAQREIEIARQRYDHLVVNDRLERAIDEVVQLIQL